MELSCGKLLSDSGGSSKSCKLGTLAKPNSTFFTTTVVPPLQHNPTGYAHAHPGSKRRVVLLAPPQILPRKACRGTCNIFRCEASATPPICLEDAKNYATRLWYRNRVEQITKQLASNHVYPLHRSFPCATKSNTASFRRNSLNVDALKDERRIWDQSLALRG